MKILAALLLAILLCITYVNAKDEQCEKNGGRCVVSSSAKGGSCKRLPYQCAPDTLCCKKTRTIRQGTKRKCKKIMKKCKKEGGACVSAKDGTCDTVTVDKLCKGSSCTCCLGDKKSCKSSDCKMKGGFCINIKKPAYCPGGTIDANLCEGKKCACCIINKPVNCQCGQANEARIVGGEEVSPNNKYPWMVGMASPIMLENAYLCGATLISDRYVVTAAHCFYLYSGPLLAKYIKIGLADHNVNSADDDVPGVTRLADIETYTVHINYDFVTMDNDIALIKLKEPLDLSSHKEIKPVCLPKNKGETYEGADGTVAGWGTTVPNDYETGSDLLLEVTVPILGNAECDTLGLSNPVTDNMLCAGLKKGGKGSCFRDSGSPLVVKEGSTHTLVGLESWYEGCAARNSPDVYTRITQYLDWIIENTSDAKYCS